MASKRGMIQDGAAKKTAGTKGKLAKKTTAKRKVAKRKDDAKKDAKKKGGIIKDEFKARYRGISEDKVSCGDTLANELRSFCKPDGKKVDLSAVEKVAKDNGIDLSIWDHLNLGMVRMNMGNVLRTKIRKGEEVVIGKKKIKVLAG